MLIARLRRAHTSTFRALTADSPNLLTTVARFLALLELFREGAVGFEQLTPLGELTVRWIGTDDGELAISDEFDDLAFSEPTSVQEPEMIDQGHSTDDTEAEVPAVRSPQDVSGEVEALLLLAEEPISEDALAEAIDVPRSVIEECLAELMAFYDETGRGFELRQLGGGWRYYTREEHADLVARYALAPQQSKLSQAALETLAVVAYSQPISRGRISAVRGVNVDGVIRTLVARGLINEAGHDAESGAVVFATTPYFLERMGLRSLDELPELAPHLPEVTELENELRQFATPGPEPSDRSPEPVERQAERASTTSTSESGDD